MKIDATKCKTLMISIKPGTFCCNLLMKMKHHILCVKKVFRLSVKSGIALLFIQTIFSHENDRKIIFPDIQGYKTLKCDLHMHTVFSDGSVWPDIRVQEAVKDGIDAIAITEHIEYQPHKNDIPHPDRNRSHEVAKNALQEADDLLIINGSEITRRMPPGHSNAIFLDDANKLLTTDVMDVFEEAGKQDAFIFWNHPDWVAQAPDGVPPIDSIHYELIKKDLLHGIEIVNDLTYSDEALQIALDNDLTILGTSDIHGIVDWQYKIPEGGHRPVTLVFARERTEDSLKEALFDKRTVVWFNNTLIGRPQNLVPLIEACITVQDVQYYRDYLIARVSLINHSDVEFILRNTGEYRFDTYADVVIIMPNSVTQVGVKTLEKLDEFIMKFEVMNAVTAPAEHPEIIIRISTNKSE